MSVQKCETIFKLYPLCEVAEANKRKIADKICNLHIRFCYRLLWWSIGLKLFTSLAIKWKLQSIRRNYYSLVLLIKFVWACATRCHPTFPLWFSAVIIISVFDIGKQNSASRLVIISTVPVWNILCTFLGCWLIATLQQFENLSRECVLLMCTTNVFCTVINVAPYLTYTRSKLP